MTTFTATPSVVSTSTYDHRTGDIVAGGPASRYHRVARCDGRVGAHGGRRGGERPNYVARRVGVVLAALSVVLGGVQLVEALAAELAGHPVSAADVAFASDSVVVAVPSTSHVARPGDTLWSIADAHRGDVGRDRYVDALVELNGGASIQVGQAVRLP